VQCVGFVEAILVPPSEKETTPWWVCASEIPCAAPLRGDGRGEREEGERKEHRVSRGLGLRIQASGSRFLRV
jgi:hypothetical protein